MMAQRVQLGDGLSQNVLQIPDCASRANSYPDSESACVIDSLFQMMLADAALLKKRNSDFSDSLESLVTIATEKLIPSEVELGELLKQVLNKQLKYTKRVTLKQKHSRELHLWMDEILHSLRCMGLADDETVEKVSLAHAINKNIPINRHCNSSVAMQVAQFYANEEKLQNDTSDSKSDPSSIPSSADLSNDLHGKVNSVETATVVDENILQVSAVEKLHGEISSEQLDDKIFQKIFRKVTNALHPDKEPDSQVRERKQALMSTLLEARKKYDIVVLLELYSEFISEPFIATPDQKRSLMTVLYHYIKEQESQAFNPVYRSAMHVSVYRKFYAGTSAENQDNIARYLSTLRNRKKHLIEFTSDVNTIFKLGRFLDKRIANL